jgi:hypothetical protein
MTQYAQINVSLISTMIVILMTCYLGIESRLLPQCRDVNHDDTCNNSKRYVLA